MRSLFFVSAAALMLTAASAHAEDNPACARFENPLEYNACLAKLGPRAGATLGVPEPAGAGRPTGAARSMRAFAGARRTRGRVRMEFSIRRR